MRMIATSALLAGVALGVLYGAKMYAAPDLKILETLRAGSAGAQVGELASQDVQCLTKEEWQRKALAAFDRAVAKMDRTGLDSCSAAILGPTKRVPPVRPLFDFELRPALGIMEN